MRIISLKQFMYANNGISQHDNVLTKMRQIHHMSTKNHDKIFGTSYL